LGHHAAGTREAPIPSAGTPYAAALGESCRIHKEGERCLLKLGGTVTAGDLLKSDASGNGVSCSTSAATMQNFGAMALMGGISGELIEVEVRFGSVTPT
jgi:hypothetical protein